MRESATREPITYVTQSKFFSPAFNAAIFDGPIRIYFAQHQESLALKVYFHLQERFCDIRKEVRGQLRDRARNVFVMLYPTLETFDLSFKGDDANLSALDVSAESLASGAGAWSGRQVVKTRLGQDFVVGVRGPLDEDDFQELDHELDSIFRKNLA
jgi:hypothetical protein